MSPDGADGIERHGVDPVASAGSQGRLADASLVIGLLVLLVGREAIQLDRARSNVLAATAMTASATGDHDRTAAAWEVGRAQRAAIERAAITAGQALVLAGLALSAWGGAPSARWVWRTLLAWFLLLLFAPDAAVSERLR